MSTLNTEGSSTDGVSALFMQINEGTVKLRSSSRSPRRAAPVRTLLPPAAGSHSRGNTPRSPRTEQITTREQLEQLSIAQIFEYIQSLQKNIVTLEEKIIEKDITITDLRNTAQLLQNELKTSPRDKDKEENSEDDCDNDPILAQQLAILLDKEEEPQLMRHRNLQLERRSISFDDFRGIIGEVEIEETGKPPSALTKSVDSVHPAPSAPNLEVQTNDPMGITPDLILSCGGFVVESGYFPIDAVDFMSANKPYYTSYYQAKDHINMISCDTPWKTAIASIAQDTFHYRILLRSRIGDSIHLIEKTKIGKGLRSFARKLFKNISPALGSCKWNTIADEVLHSDLLKFEEQMFHHKFKVGVLYAKEGQRSEEEMFCNQNGSDAYNEFLEFLGDRVELDGWKHFAGGLDTRTNTTGTHSIYKEYQDYEIMFHVSTLLPFYPADPQQVERKRHLGNDIVVILFSDSSIPYKPTIISSNFIHITIVVQPLRDYAGNTTYYRVWCVNKDTVEGFGPQIPKPPIFAKDNQFKEFLYRKIINAELACYKSEQFVQKLQNTREVYLNDIAKRHIK